MADYDVTTASSALEFDTVQTIHIAKPIAIDTNHFIATYGGEGGDGYAQVFTVDTSTWAVSTSSARLEFDTTLGHYNQIQKIDTNHYFIAWSGSGNDGYVQVLNVDTTTWAVTTAAASLEWEVALSRWQSVVPVDTNHFVMFTEGNASDGFAVVFAVDTTTWAVTTTSVLEFDTRNSSWNTACMIDTNHFVNFWLGGATAVDSFAQVFTVNTTTWAVTTAAAAKQWITTNVALNMQAYKVDTNHFITFYQDQTSTDGFVQVFTVNTTTWAVTTASSVLEFDTQDYQTAGNGAISRVDTNHFLFTWASVDTAAGAAHDGFAQVFAVNTTTWAVTTAAASIEYETTQGEYPATSEIIAGSTNKYLLLFSGPGDDGFAQTLDVEIPGGNIDLTVADSLLSVTLDNVALTQANTLAVNDALSSSTLDNVALTQANTLAGVGDMLSGSTVDNTVLTTDTPLIVADLLSSSTVENTDLTQANTLAVADSLSSSTVENIVLETEVVLTVADSLSSSTVDNVALTQANTIAVADLLSSTTIDEPTLTTDTPLVVQDATSSTTLEAPTLTQANVLAVADALSSSTVDNIALVQANTIAVADLLSDTTVDNTELGTELSLIIADMLSSTTVDNVALTQANVLTIQDMISSSSLANVKLRLLVEERDYYIDASGNLYWVISQEIGLVEKV